MTPERGLLSRLRWSVSALAHQMVVIPPAIRRRFPEVLWDGTPTGQQIALTFDDGPDPKDTPALLDVLERHNVTASFFVIGEKAKAHPDLIAAIAAAGHQLCLHGYRHRSFLLTGKQQLRTQLTHSRDLICDISGRQPSQVFHVRPPFGHFTPGILRSLISWGFQPVIGSIIPPHWLQASERTIIQATLNVVPGSLIVLHESLGGPPIADLTNIILSRLHADEYDFITVEQLGATRQADPPDGSLVK